MIRKPQEGGHSLLVDGFYCAEELKRTNPRDFETITQLDVESRIFENGKWDLRYTDKIIKKNALNEEQLVQIRLLFIFYLFKES